MSRVCVSLFVLFLVLNIAVQIGDCDDTPKVNCEKVTPASEKAELSGLEKKLQWIQKFGNSIGSGFRNASGQLKKKLDKLTKSFKTDGKEYRGPENRSFQSDIQLILGDKKIRTTILPGTRWCGDGDIAKDENDLGSLKVDVCCRAHDQCQNNIVTGESKENLINNGIFTKSACACDKAFYNCLKGAGGLVANAIGITYFNTLKPQCFKCVCPKGDCNADTSSSECKGQCSRYQWINSAHF